MEIVPDDVFLTWAAEAGLEPDACYPASKQLVFAACRDCWRAWALPSEPAQLKSFIRSVLEIASPAGQFRFRLRGGGVWTSEPSADDHELDRTFRALGVPINIAGAIELSPQEIETAIGLAEACASHGVCVGTDLEIVPLERRACLMMSHHNEIEAHFATSVDLESFLAGMEAAGHRLADE